MQDDILVGLNPAQREAVTTVKGPVLVLAGPGSGKTRVLAHRVAYLLRVAGAHPRSVMAVTFTNKAAGEMRERINKLLGESVPVSTGWRGLTIGTFHSICARILRAEAGPAGLNPNFVIYDDGEQLTAVKQALRDLKLDEKMYRPEAMRGAISKAKNELVKPEAFEASTYWGEIARRVYARYDEIMTANGALDFDDLLTRTTWLFQEQPEVLKRYQERYQYLLVDEFQDTNTAQYEMVRLLAGKSHNLFAVGDEDQCVVAGTAIMTPDGAVPVESLRVGDRVVAASGHGAVAQGQIDGCPSRFYAGPVWAIETAGGRQVVATPQHCAFARYPKEGFDSADEPTNVILSGCADQHSPRQVASEESPCDFESRDASLAERRGVSGVADPFSMTVAQDALGTAVEENILLDDFSRQALLAATAPSWPDQVTEVIAARSRLHSGQRARLTGHLYDFMPIGNLLPGALVPVLGPDGHIEEDEVVSVSRERYVGLVFDLSVPNYRNYVAGGIVVHNSIYAFRGADYRNVMRFREDYPDARVILLEQNYRSTQTILDVANAVITKNRFRTPKKLRTDRGSGLQVILHEAYDESDEAAFVAGTIQRLVSQRQATLGDCAVMYRTNAQSRSLEDAFVARGMPYRLVGGTRFYQRKEIKDALAYLRLTHNPADNVSLGRVINVPPRGIGEKTISALSAWSGELGVSMVGGLALVAGDLKSPALDEDALARFPKPPVHPFGAAAQRALVAFYRMLAGWIAAKDGLTVAALIDRIAEQSGYATWLRDGTEEGEDRWANLQELRSVAAHYDDFPPELRLTAFLEEVALVSDQDELAEPEDRVTLLTLHTAKGLEFPVVFIVGLEENILPHSRSMEDPDQMEEERRLMYVGVTRAKDRLYLVRAFRRMIWGRSEVYEPSRFLKDVKGAMSGVGEQGSRGVLREEQGSKGAGERGSGGAGAWHPPVILRPRNEQDRPSVAVSWSPGAFTRPAAGKRPDESERQPQFKPGDRVDHGLFGQGIVLKSELTGDDEEVTVTFAGKGTKTLLASFAKLRKVS